MTTVGREQELLEDVEDRLWDALRKHNYRRAEETCYEAERLARLIMQQADEPPDLDAYTFIEKNNAMWFFNELASTLRRWHHDNQIRSLAANRRKVPSGGPFGIVERYILEPLASVLTLPHRAVFTYDKYQRERRDPLLNSRSPKQFTLNKGMEDTDPHRQIVVYNRLEAVEEQLDELDRVMRHYLEKRDINRAIIFGMLAELFARRLLHTYADMKDLETAQRFHQRMWHYRDYIHELREG